jgi:hypothetical protein
MIAIKPYLCLLPLLLLGLAGCQKFVAVDPPATQLTETQVFTSEAGAVSAVAGVYSSMGQFNLNLFNGGITLYAGLSADELANTATNNSFDAYRRNELLPTETSLSSRFWTAAYRTIYMTNAILEGLQQSNALSPATKAQLRGEMLTLRSFAYFYLVNFFGAVPLVKGTNYEVNAVLGRTATDTVYASIISDLREAKTLLAPSYAGLNRGRVNRWTATALLARSYLYIGNWAAAESEATEVLQSGMYTLAGTPAQTFSLSSNEVLWRLLRDNNNSAEGNTFVPASATTRPALALTPALIASFETGDTRRTAWVSTNTVAGQPFHYPAKYRVRTNAPITEALVVVRLAEVYLIRAEARARLDRLTEGALDLNTLRARAGLAPFTPADRPALLAAIARERRIELFAEWGHRWLDLKRTGLANDVLQPLKGATWQASDQLYPLPLTELQKNPFLVQNPGY